MKSIGLIGYFLDEWHAEHYPEWIEQATNGRMKVNYAFGLVDSETGMTNKMWSDKKKIQLLNSIEQLVELSDYLLVLAPDHPEHHEKLAALPLQSGKPTFVDKTLALERAAAIQMFELADQHGTPLYSSSALRFAREYANADRIGIETITSLGPGKYDNYAIHQIEPIVSLMGTEARRVMFVGTPGYPSLLIEFTGGRQAMINHFGWECPFLLAVNHRSGDSAILKPESDYFAEFIRNFTQFFESGKPTVSREETLAIITLIEYGLKALKKPFQWTELPD